MPAGVNPLQAKVRIGAVGPWRGLEGDAKIGLHANDFGVGGELLPEPTSKFSTRSVPGRAIRADEVMTKPR